MNFIGAYHLNHPQVLHGICDAPCIMKGDDILCAEDIYASEDLLAFAQGTIRNRGALAVDLQLPEDARQSALVAAAYRAWGADYPARIEGPVITAVFDRAADAFVLSRDRMGELPLFYCMHGGTLAFSGHPDALLKSGLLQPIVDAAGLGELFALGPARTPGRTAYRDLLEVEPGFQICGQEGRIQVERYYSLPVYAHRDGDKETIHRVRELVERAVDDVLSLQPAAMLSGGLDSTALTALMRSHGACVKSFSVDYAQNDRFFQASAFQPERDAPYVALAADALGTEHMSVMLSQQALAAALEEAVDARGFPGMADIDSSLLLFAREIAPYAGAVVSGECGDEVFGGYPWFRDASMLREDAFPWSGSVELRGRILRGDIQRRVAVSDYVRQTLRRALAEVEPLPGEDAEDARLRAMQQLCFRFFMANLQERAACMCGACGLTVVTPFCDDRLVEYVYNVPWRMKFMGGQEKGLLRAAVADLLPESLLRRKKSPYPKSCNPEYAQIIVQMTNAILADPDAPILQLVDAEMLRRITVSELSPVETPWFGQLMAGPQMLAYLLQVNAWMRSRDVRIEL